MVKATYSISQVAQATGISVDTLRTWERRFGKPQPQRTPSGRRVYDESDVAWLRRAAEALTLGVPPRQIVPLSLEALNRVLRSARISSVGPDAPMVEEVLDAVRDLNPRRVRSLLKTQASQRPFIEFVDHLLAPVVVRAGLEWESGAADVYHEHLLTQVVLDVLAQIRGWCQVAPNSTPTVLITTLPDEHHAVGLSILSTACTLEGFGLLDIGVATPVKSIAAAAAQSGVAIVGLSVSMNHAGPDAKASLEELRSLLPADVAVTLGGAGSRRISQRVSGVLAFDELAQWIAFVRERER